MNPSDHVDVLAFGAHPDDVEIFAGGTVCTLVNRGYRVGIVDLTAGELGSRGSSALRTEESSDAAAIMGVRFRENLGIPDGNIELTVENRNRIISVLRKYRPGVLLIPAPECRHPDHGAAARLIAESAFFSGLSKIGIPDASGLTLDPWRPDHVLHYMQSIPFEPSIVMNVSGAWTQRCKAVQAYHSQVFDASYEKGEDEPETFVSDPGFARWMEARARSFGYRIGAEFGEPFLYRHGPIGTDDLVRFLGRDSDIQSPES
jgi:bacillithiol biosynthesis deacetylase BshB1